MAFFLGIDTSNYTTSVAIYDGATGDLQQCRKLLEVKPGEKGLQQSNAVFQHVRALPVLIEDLVLKCGVHSFDAVGASTRPRSLEGSYMPCFTVGEGHSRTVAALNAIPFYEFSHQAGHIAAALFSAGQLDMLKSDKPFIAFHVSGGTTEAVMVSMGENFEMHTRLIAQSIDLKAGQLIDRVGLMLGLKFPAGPALENLAVQSQAIYTPVPTMKGLDCCLSGIENQCKAMLQKGEKSCDIANFCLASVLEAIVTMTKKIRIQYPDARLLYAGGVMSNAKIRQTMTSRYDACFAQNGFSSDNAAGIAVLTKLRTEGI